MLHSETLNASDKFSFDLPSISGDEDWKALVDKVFADAEDLAKMIGQMPQEKLHLRCYFHLSMCHPFQGSVLLLRILEVSLSKWHGSGLRFFARGELQKNAAIAG